MSDESDFYLQFLDHSYLRVHSEDDGLLQELSDFYTFDVPGARFSPQFKKGYWDGKIRLYSIKTRKILTGLRHHICQWADERGYSVALDPEFNLLDQGIAPHDRVAVPQDLGSLSPRHNPRDYQDAAVRGAIAESRAVLVSPTGSGKSLIAYYLAQLLPKPVLLIVPNIGLVHQMFKDFYDYGWQGSVCKMYGGTKFEPAELVISTWQTLASRFPNVTFPTVICDEVHHAKAKELSAIMESLKWTKSRFGLTGTMDDIQTNRLVIMGHFGKIIQVETMRGLMDDGHLANLKIKGVLLKYPKEIMKGFKGVDYPDECTWLGQNPRRNKFLMDFAKSLKGNTLILYRLVEKHGEELFKLVTETSADAAKQPIMFVSGKVDPKEREVIREKISTLESSVTIASEGTWGEGTNIPNVHNIIFASPSQSRIKVMQKIGRGLRKTADKKQCVLYDVADDLSPSARKMNYTFKHYIQRVNYYTEEHFEFDQIRLNLYDLYR